MNVIQGSSSSGEPEQTPSYTAQSGAGGFYGSYGSGPEGTYGSHGSGGYGSYGPGGYGSGGYGAGGYGGYGSGGYGSGGGNWGGSYSPPPQPGKRRSRRVLAFAAAGVVVAGAAVGGSLAATQTSGSGSDQATTSSTTKLTTAQVASRVSPGLVDINTTLGYESAKAAGTGMVLTSTGEILTNNHVIDGATSISVTDIGNGKTYTASVVGYDASKDIAVLQLKNASGLQTVSLGDSSSVTTGQKVVAIGNAGGKGGTPSVVSGSVTALSQSITASDEGSGDSEQLSGLIESNAPIQAGDSGGPLVNSSGQVIGMDTAASSASSDPDAQSVNPGSGEGSSGSTSTGSSGQTSTATQAFSIPIDEAETVAAQIEAGTSSSTVHIGSTGFLGVEVASSGSSSAGVGGTGAGGYGSQGGYGGTSTSSGALVEGTVSGSPAAGAGLTEGDTITSVAGQTITSASQISSILGTDHPGDKVSISWTDSLGESHTATVTLATGPAA